MIDAYPLTWPTGWKRTPVSSRKRSRFSKELRAQYGPITDRLTVANGVDRCLAVLRRMDVGSWNVIISTNVQTTRDGFPRSGMREPEDAGAAVYWRDKNDAQRVMAIDQYDRLADNLAAIAATLDAMRAIERHGGAAILDRAFTGFAALPAPGQTAARGWREILKVASTATREDVELSYKTLRSSNHPDKGGDADEFNAVQKAYEQSIQELGI